MAFVSDTSELPQVRFTPQIAVGMASPLWGLFAGAAMTGVAFWWLSAWTRPQNLEALFGAAVTPRGAGVTTPLPLVETAVVMKPVAEVEAAVKAVVEAAAEPVLESAKTVLQAVAPEPEAAESKPAPAKPKAPTGAKPA